jgi:serine/threonine protein kinase/tetratricopeptide (TPR) repeat protein
MTSPRWDLVTRIFNAAIEQSQSARNDFVRHECKGDAKLEEDVIKLLFADQRAGSFLEKSPLTTLSKQSVVACPLSLLSIGSIVSGRFKILRFIGQGGMGQVYEALDLELKGRVALKAIRPDISSDLHVVSRFKREVQLTRRITHPNVCRTFDIERHISGEGNGLEDDLTFLTMELLEGETLADFLRRQGRLTTVEALPLVLQMIDALSAAHSVDIVHRDFKPSNILLVPSEKALRVVVTDFGLARALASDDEVSVDSRTSHRTGAGNLMGTLVYMAPEQFERGEATAASDIYSLGLVMFEMVTGERPFADAIPFAEAAKRIKQAAPSPRLFVPELNPAWDVAICKCLESEPDKRFQRVRQVAEEIASEQSGSASRTPRLQGRPKQGQVSAPANSHRNSSWRKGIGAILLFAMMSLSVAVLRHYQVSREAKLAGGASVLLTEIQNGTGDERFAGTTELIRHQLSQSPYFNLMDAGRIRYVLTQMTKPLNAPLDPPTAREVALRSGAPRLIFGGVSRVGDSYVLDIDIEQPDNNPLRFRAHWENHWTWTVPSVDSGKEMPASFLDVVRDSSDWIRSQVGESANDIARIDVPPQDVTTGNWEALSEFAQAEKFRAAGQNDSAIVALQNAVAADSHFALAHMRLGDVLVSLSRFTEGYRAYQRALAQGQQQRLTRRENDRLTGIYALDIENFQTAETAFRDYTVYYPNDYLGWFYRATPLMMMGRVEEAIASLKKAAEIDPQKMFAPAHIARFDLILGHFEDASRWIQHLRDTGHSDDADLVEGESHFLQGRYEESLARFTKLKESRDALYRSYSYSLLARLFAERGQYQNALNALEQGIAGDLETGDRVHRADKILDRAYISLQQEKYDVSIEDIASALDLDRSLQRSLAAGTVLGEAIFEATGRTKLQLTAQLRRVEALLPPGDFKPLSEIVRFRLRGEIFLAGGNWKSAIHEFQKADELESPIDDKAYLARALFTAAQHTLELTAAASLRQGALTAFSGSALNPGRTWQLALSHPPGESSNAFRSYARLASESGRVDENFKIRVAEYMNRRRQSDTVSNDIREAQRWLQ